MRLHDVITQLEENSAAILLVHEPDFADTSAATGKFDLQISGHTHGGQIRFTLGNRQWSPASLITPFAVGLYRLPFGPGGPTASEKTAAHPQECAFLYVNPGLGTLGLPLRLGVPPEITVLTLRAAG